MILLMIAFCGVIGSLLAFGIWSLGSVPTEELISGGAVDMGKRSLLRWGVMVNHFFMFLVPVFLFGFIFHRGGYIKFLTLDRPLQLRDFFLWGVAILVSYPLVGYLTILNERIDFPDFLTSSQDKTFQMLADILTMESSGELVMNIVIVGVLAAIGEELLFRGIIQQKLQKYFSNPHLAVILAGILFGGIHMQAERILPLSILGILLGYSFYYSKCILIPIILHFLNNSVQVVSLYSLEEIEVSNLQEAPEIPVWMLIVSIIGTVGIIQYSKGKAGDENEV